MEKLQSHVHDVLCGQIFKYEKDLPYPPLIPDHITQFLMENNITRERYTMLNYPEKFQELLVQLEAWLNEGKLKSHGTFEFGLENAGKAFVSIMKLMPELITCKQVAIVIITWDDFHKAELETVYF